VLQIIGWFAAGILLGTMLRGRARLIGAAARASELCILFLLFVLGLSIGGNQAVITSLPEIGAKSAALCLGGLLGSVAVCVLLERFLARSSR
jgi:uncharacterized membrane protein YbjE (DUF340 family)